MTAMATAKMSRLALFTALAATLFGASASAQTPTAERTPALALKADVGSAGMNANTLRTALERELSLPVRLEETAPEGAHLSVTASSQTAVNVSFVRADGSSIERTVDVSNAGGHVDETLGLVAANLMRDEASDLLDALRAAQPAPPQPRAAPAPKSVPQPAPEPPAPHGCEPNALRKIPIGLDVLPYVGMSTNDKTDVERMFSFNLFGGISGAVRGFELGGFLNLVDQSVCGVQITGGANLVNGPVRGVQFGMVNLARGRVDGAQFGMISGSGGPLRGVQYGMVNWAHGPIEGAQFGLVQGGLGSLKGAQFGLVDFAAGDIQGAQFGLVNVGTGSLTGAQFGLVDFARSDSLGLQAGTVNVVGGSFTGAQLGNANLTVSDFTGAQLGLANVSGGRTTGLQLGLANVSVGRMHGAMIGLLNVAEDSNAAIGLVNVLWKGRAQVDVWGTDFGVASVGLVHGGSNGGVHNIYGIGITARHDEAIFAPSFGIGVRAVEKPRFFVDIDAVATWLFFHDTLQDELDDSVIGTLRVPVGYRITEAIAVFVSPAINVSVARRDENSLEDPSVLGGTRLTGDGANMLVRLWPGFNAGVRFF
jgi:uncharacterized protein YjbI with pentapeptide repeats